MRKGAEKAAIAIESVRERIEEVPGSAVSAGQASFLLLERIEKLLEENNDLLRSQAKLDPADRSRPVPQRVKEKGRRWWRF